ncbi:hypothetical protein M3Y99_01058500 [Aphelenchoides fujianensis]|nr:hypothetical protein M3Y99_01058500 [Aphelenchoides fujianensis]
MGGVTASFKGILGLLATAALLFFFLVNLRVSRSPSSFFDRIRAFQGSHFSSASNETDEPLHECILPKLDPWNPEVLRLVDPSHDPLRGCKPTFVRRSRLKDGQLLVNQTAAQLHDGEKCFFRCLLPVDDWTLEFGEWLPVGANGSRPKCDVFDVHCNQTNATTYKFLHTQIHERPRTKEKPPAGSPDVYIIGLDSVSTSQFFRSMPLTTHFLRAEMDVVFFPYANKVGLNSRPNAYGFLVGEQPENSLPNPWGKEQLGGRSDELCGQPMEKENVVFFDYRDRGYRTMMVEDWRVPSLQPLLLVFVAYFRSEGIFTWYACKGFTHPPVEHFLNPFVLRVEGRKKDKDAELKTLLFDRQCKERHTYVLEIMEEFLGKYPQQPKFSYAGMVHLAHEDDNGLYHVDQQFRDFFARIEQKLRNSFVVFMADHGLRFGSVRQTRTGEMEDHNPFLAIIVPEHLRGNSQLMKQMHENSQQLTSHFDLYATLLEIVEQGAEWNKTTDFSATTFVPSNRTLLGSSLLHPLPQPRTCESLHIPFQYCLCQHEFSLIKDETIAVRVAELAVAKMNEEVARSEYRDNCTRLSVDREQTARSELQEFKPQGERRIFRVNFGLLPSGGLYDTFAEMTGDSIRLIAENFPRHDSYKKQASCIPENFIRNYCFCPQSSA